MRKKRSLGIAFGVSKTTLNSGHFKKAQDKNWEDNLLPNFNPSIFELTKSAWRAVFFIAVTITIFFILFLRLFHLQIVEGSKNRQLADGNRIQVKVVHAPRGVIFDRNGKIIAQNNPGFRLIDDKSKRTTYISRDAALQMEIKGDPRLQNLEIDSIRVYPLGEKTVHILGYVGEITAQELENPKFKNYKLGDKIGRGGVEEVYESFLKGIDGGEVIEVDAEGRKIRTLRKEDAIPGKNLYLTIDSDLQNLSFEELKEGIEKSGSCCGALISQNPQNGEILSLVSIPSFDPNNIEDALTAPNSPILNRVIAGVYPPGSTFKIASALAGLSSGKITTSTHFQDDGFIYLGPFKFTNWYFTQYGRTEGLVDLTKALERSNDIYFYRLGEIVGEDILGQGAKKLGFASKLGIDIPGEATGLIPDNAWKVKNIGEVWFPGDTLHMAIGQGFVLSTPIQISNLISFIASGGIQYKPHLALKVTNSDGKIIKEFKSTPVKKDFKISDIEIVKKGLEEVPKDGGTAWPFFSFPIATAGKTGTAEFGDPKDRTHAWYTAYAPIDDPKIATTVLIEAGGEGSTNASPVVKEVFRWFLSPNKNNLIKDVGQIATESARRLGE